MLSDDSKCILIYIKRDKDENKIIMGTFFSFFLLKIRWKIICFKRSEILYETW